MAGDIPDFLEATQAAYEDGWKSAMAEKRPCACGGGNILADGLIGGWCGEREGKIGILDILVDYESVGAVQLDKHVRIVEVDDALPTEEGT